MKKLIAFGLALVAVLFMGATPVDVVPRLAQGIRPAGDSVLMQLLNGVPVKIGVLTSTGTSVTQATTGVPFALTAEKVIEVVCDGQGFVKIGATASSDYTDANFGRPMTSGVSRWFILRTGDTNISLDTAGATVNCAVDEMN